MPRVLGRTGEPSPPEPNEADVAVQLNVPQEFAGMAMSELNTRRGQVKGMDVLVDHVLIRASVPESEFDELKKAIDAGTQHRGGLRRFNSYAERRRAEMHIRKAWVLKKSLSLQNRRTFRDRKCLLKVRTSIAGLPDAKFF